MGVSMPCWVQSKPKKARQMKSKVKSTLIIFFSIKGIIHKEFDLTGQTIQFCILLRYFTAAVKMCNDFIPNFGDKRTGSCITAMHCLTLPFSPGIFYQKQHDCHPSPVTIFCFPH
jgi:hypothetical protein